MKAPGFWAHGKGGLLAALLAPLGALYASGTARRLAKGEPYRAGVPVICVGNLIAGGAGKTPTVMALASLLIREGHSPHILSRGYKGQITRPVRVAPERHSSEDVGDEPLLLAATAPVWVGRDRGISARDAVQAGATVLLMDDGFQNPGLYKDIGLVVLDGGFGFGNGHMIPAGPLREPVAVGLARATAVLVIGEDSSGCREQIPGNVDLLEGSLKVEGNLEAWVGKRVFAFAGIGRPPKFYDSLRGAGAEVVGTRDFADHYPYTVDDMTALLAEATALGARLVTTAKDRLRIPLALRDQVDILTISLEWDEEAVLKLLKPVLSA